MCDTICTLAPDPANIKGGFAHVYNKCLYSALVCFTPLVYCTPMLHCLPIVSGIVELSNSL